MSDEGDSHGFPARGAGRAHTIQDHRGGIDAGHAHGSEAADHDHDDFDREPGAADEALWLQDNVVLTSVGIDVGSASTQVNFSAIHLQRISDQLSTRYVVVSREPMYRSPTTLTPYLGETLIDGRALGEIIEDAYAASGLRAHEVDSGAVILTGEALRRDNAPAIAEAIAERGGEFVCAAAGHHLECMLAVHGSGAARRSYDTSTRILNVDIGGGTTKLGLAREGEVEATAAVCVGGRLLVVDGGGRITRLDPAGREHARRAGFDWRVGSLVRPPELARVAEGMADALLRILQRRATREDARELLLTEALPPAHPIDGVMFSGGVGEYVYRRESREFGDVGKLLGEAVRARLDAGALPYPLLPPGECLHATVLGASEYSVQLSGNTTYVSAPSALLPRRNLQVVPLGTSLGERIDPEQVTRALERSLLWHDLVEGERDLAYSVRWSGEPSYERLAALARGLLGAIPRTLRSRRPVYVITDGDIAHTLGHLLEEDPRVTGEVLVLDGITLLGFDFVDLGRVRIPSLTVPVTIKSLVFGDEPRTERGAAQGGWRRQNGAPCPPGRRRVPPRDAGPGRGGAGV